MVKTWRVGCRRPKTQLGKGVSTTAGCGAAAALAWAALATRRIIALCWAWNFCKARAWWHLALRAFCQGTRPIAAAGAVLVCSRLRPVGCSRRRFGVVVAAGCLVAAVFSLAGVSWLLADAGVAAAS